MGEGVSAKRAAWVVIDVLGYGFGLLLIVNFVVNVWLSEVPEVRIVCAALALLLTALLVTMARRQFRR